MKCIRNFMAGLHKLRCAVVLPFFCILLSGCQPPGPIGEIALGWWNNKDDLAKLEDILVVNGLQPQLQDYLSAESQAESGKPWRYRSDGVTYSYFAFPPRDPATAAAPEYREGEPPPRVVISLSERLGRLNITFGAWRGDCSTKRFFKQDEALIEDLAIRIGERFKRRIKVRYTDSERC